MKLIRAAARGPRRQGSARADDPHRPAQGRAAYVVLEALIDLICVISSCPFDLKVEGWTINAAQGPSELLVS